MNANEIVRALRNSCSGCNPTPCCEFEVLGPEAADLIESLQAENKALREASQKVLEGLQKLDSALDNTTCDGDALKARAEESQRREKAAVDDMKQTHCIGTSCYICKNHGKCERECIEIGHCALFEWRGPQEAGEDANENSKDN